MRTILSVKSTTKQSTKFSEKNKDFYANIYSSDLILLASQAFISYYLVKKKYNNFSVK